MTSRSEVDSPSSGICTAYAELRVELARDFRVWVDDFRDTVASELRAARIFARTDVLPGILAIIVVVVSRIAGFCCRFHTYSKQSGLPIPDIIRTY
jgi:hypothetical protein